MTYGTWTKTFALPCDFCSMVAQFDWASFDFRRGTMLSSVGRTELHNSSLQYNTSLTAGVLRHSTSGTDNPEVCLAYRVRWIGQPLVQDSARCTLAQALKIGVEFACESCIWNSDSDLLRWLYVGDRTVVRSFDDSFKTLIRVPVLWLTWHRYQMRTLPSTWIIVPSTEFLSRVVDNGCHQKHRLVTK